MIKYILYILMAMIIVLMLTVVCIASDRIVIQKYGWGVTYRNGNTGAYMGKAYRNLNDTYNVYDKNGALMFKSMKTPNGQVFTSQRKSKADVDKIIKDRYQSYKKRMEDKRLGRLKYIQTYKNTNKGINNRNSKNRYVGGLHGPMKTDSTGIYPARKFDLRGNPINYTQIIDGAAPGGRIFVPK